MNKIHANCLPVLIGSLPLKNHKEATRLIFEYTPEIPLWAQLPSFREEGMITQFLSGFPGVRRENEKIFIDKSTPTFDQDILKFYEEYISITEGNDISDSRFSLSRETAIGFFELLDYIYTLNKKPAVIKGQITGPVTFGTGLSDREGKAIFYDDQLKDIAVKLLAMKGKWQAKQFSKTGALPVIFFDEPALAGYGTSAYVTITKEDVISCINEVAAAVHEERGLAGVHVCANTEWAILLDSDIDIISFDAYSFFDKFILYGDRIKKFFEQDRIIAWGIVPTLNPDEVEKESAESLLLKLKEQIKQTAALGIKREKILSQILISPSCGTGSLSIDNAKKVLKLTKEISDKLRKDEFKIK